MTLSEYRDYEKSVKSFFDYNNISHLSPIYQEWDPYFTWRNCDCCSRFLGGDRVECNSFNNKTKEIVGTYEVCMDCYYYAEYGQLDDMTMLEIGDTQASIFQ